MGGNGFSSNLTGIVANPFNFPTELLDEHIFCEKLVGQEDRDALAWSMPLVVYDSEDKEFEKQKQREVQAIATQDKCPDRLSFAGYVEFCTMRGNTSLQLRNVLRALRNKRMPLTDPNVHQVLRQTLFQFGPFHRISLASQQDTEEALGAQDCNYVPVADYVRLILLECHDANLGMFVKMHKVLSVLVDVHREKPRDHMAMAFLVELVDVFVAWHMPFAGLLADIAEATVKWAQQRIDRPIVEDSETDLVLISFYLFCALSAFLSFPSWSSQNLTERDCLQRVLTTMMRLYTYRIPENSIKDEKLRWCYKNMRARVQNQIASKVSVLIAHVHGNRNEILSGAVRVVFPTIPAAADNSLTWEVLQSERTNVVYWAKCPEPNGPVYSLNMLTGSFLVDGAPPMRLPNSILDNALFVRTFGSMDFKVMRSDASTFRTTRTFGKAWYKFRVSAGLNDELCCTETMEVGDGTNLMLELLDPEYLRQFWPMETARHLIERCTHWLCRDLGVIFFRSFMAQASDLQTEKEFLFQRVLYVLIFSVSLSLWLALRLTCSHTLNRRIQSVETGSCSLVHLCKIVDRTQVRGHVLCVPRQVLCVLAHMYVHT